MGSRLKKLRLEYGVLQKDLAEKLNLSQQTTSLYESNKRQPDNNTLITLAKFFNVSTDYILEICDELYELSPESQEEIRKLIKMYKL